MAGKINVGLTVALQGLAQTQKQLSALGKSINTVGKTAGVAAIGYGVFVAAVKGGDFVMSAVAGARDLERNLLGLKSVFEDVTPQMRQFSIVAEEVGMSQTQAAKASTFIGSVLKQSGFSIQETADLTERLVRLGTDLSLTYGYDVQEALMGMTALFRGEYDPIEKFGVAMKQSEINSELAARKLDHLTGAARRFAEQQIRVELLFQRSADAQGAFERGTGTLAVEQLKLSASFENLRDTVAVSLLPALGKITQGLRETFEAIQPDVTEAFEAMVPILSKLGETLVPKLADGALAFVDAITRTLQLVSDLLDPTTDVGLEMQKLGEEITALFETIFDEEMDATDAFDLLKTVITEVTEVARLLVAEIRNIISALKDLGNAVNIEQIFKPDTFATLVVNIGLVVGALRILRAPLGFVAGIIAKMGGGFKTASTNAVTLTTNLTALAMLIKGNPFLYLVAGLTVGAIALKDYADEVYGVKVNTEGLSEQQVEQREKLQRLQTQLQQYQYALENATEGNRELAEEGIRKTKIEIGQVEVAIKGAIGETNRFNNLKLDKIRNEANKLKAAFTESVGEINRFRNAEEGFIARFDPEFDPFGDDGNTEDKAKNYVKDFLDKLKDQVQKQTATEKLRLMGASEGLIDAILGADGWMKIWQQIKSGKIVLADLKRQFENTAAGAKELADEAKRIQDEIKKYQDDVADILANLQKELDAIAKKAADAKLVFSDLFEGFAVLSTVEREVGRFEQQFVSQLASIEDALKSAFRNEDILEEGYNALRNFARAELALLQQIGRQRDELAERFDLAKGLIDNYKRAFTAALDLTSLFGQLKEETETRTVTSVSRALMRLGGSMREFEVTISSTYEETIGGIQKKSQGILEGFRSMAEKARTFAENLRKLRDMGLNGMLFNQLVEAGIEAGGETAQALVEGGKDTINELNDLFEEIDAVGASLGEEVASSLYGSGIDMANGLLEGIRSKQAELENQARSMAEAFNRAFQSALNVQIDIVAADAAKQATEAAQKEIAKLPKPEELPPPKVVLGPEWIWDDERGGFRPPMAAEGSSIIAGTDWLTPIAKKIEEAAKNPNLNMSGLAATGQYGTQASAQVVNNYTVNVTADTRTSGAKAGEAVVETLQKFGAINGNFNVQVAV